MKVCEILIENGSEITKCFDIQLMPTFTPEIRDSLLLFVITCFISVFVVKLLQRLFLGA